MRWIEGSVHAKAEPFLVRYAPTLSVIPSKISTSLFQSFTCQSVWGVATVTFLVLVVIQLTFSTPKSNCWYLCFSDKNYC